MALIYVAALICCLLIYHIFSQKLNCRLALGRTGIPCAHPLAPYTSLWITWHRWMDREISAVQKAHARCGPIVRVGPTELIMNDMPNGVLVAHGSPGFDKTAWYDFYINYRARNAFSTYTARNHAVIRKLSARIYTKSYIQNSKHVLQILTTILFTRLLPQLDQSVRDSDQVEMLGTSFSYGIDVMTAFSFGLPVGTKLLTDPVERAEWLSIYSGSHGPPSMFWLIEFPGMEKVLSQLLPHALRLPYRRGRERFEDWMMLKVDDCDHLAAREDFESLPPGQAPLLWGQIRRSIVESSAMTTATATAAAKDHMRLPLRQKLVGLSECLDHIHATRDTFGITLTYTIHKLSQDATLQNKLFDELRTQLPTDVLKAVRQSDAGLFYEAAEQNKLMTLLEALPFLGAVVKEGLRLRNTVPTANPRSVPAGPKGEGVSLCGYVVPPETTVSCFAYSVHRREDVYEDALTFRPQRWLEGDAEKVLEMNRWFWSLGSGNRICIGQHLAMETSLYLRYISEVVDDSGFGDPSIGGFVKGDKDYLIVKFKHRTAY